MQYAENTASNVNVYGLGKEMVELLFISANNNTQVIEVMVSKNHTIEYMGRRPCRTSIPHNEFLE